MLGLGDWGDWGLRDWGLRDWGLRIRDWGNGLGLVNEGTEVRGHKG